MEGILNKAKLSVSNSFSIFRSGWFWLNLVVRCRIVSGSCQMVLESCLGKLPDSLSKLSDGLGKVTYSLGNVSDRLLFLLFLLFLIC